jgi:NhaA family Na+:H+ antiporter
VKPDTREPAHPMAESVIPFGSHRAPIERLISPFQRFAHTESAGGIVLLACTAVALVWANSPLGESYFHLWESRITIGGQVVGLTKTLHHWINDGLMVVFFFLVGLEIKREFLFGELASVRKAALPIAGAAGGMLVPAGIYAALNRGGPGAAGWGVPVATDIAFALGILALLGPRIPIGLKVFLAALAIADDIGAVLVIALFYTETISWAALGAAGVILAALFTLNRLGARQPLGYTFLGILLWIALLQSGVHATVAGVLLAATIPARTRIDTLEFLHRGRYLLGRFDEAGLERMDVPTNTGQQDAVQALEAACEQAQTPLQRIERTLHPWVAFCIIPLFALANAGVRIGGEAAALMTSRVALGIIVGLVIGKPLGITLLSWLAVRLRLAALPEGIGWRALHGVSWLGGIGFTMSLFIAALAFGEGELMPAAKLAILTASALAATAGWLLLRRAGAPPPPEE